jgi:putative oxidoreductase
MAEAREIDSPRRFAWGFLVRRMLAVLAGAVFVYAGVLKAEDPMRFASDISNYAMISWGLGVRLAFYLPWLEIFCGLALVFHRFFSGALAIAIALMLGFLGATIWARAHGIDVSCGCFGTLSSNLTLTWHLVIDVAILAALVALWFTRKPLQAPAR